MPITRTPMVDDDGSGTTGTIINNAWKTELYNQIDALDAAKGGVWVDLPFSAANFGGLSGMTWTVDAADVTTCGYSMNGKIVTFSVFISTTSVGGTLSQYLTITLPWAATRFIQVPCVITNNGVKGYGTMRIDQGEAKLRFLTTDASNWTASANNTGVYGTLSFPIA